MTSISRTKREWRRPPLARPLWAGVVAVVVFVPCAGLLMDLAGLAHPPYGYEMGTWIRDLLQAAASEGLYPVLAVSACFLGCLSFLLEAFLRLAPATRQRVSTGVVAILDLAVVLLFGMCLIWPEAAILLGALLVAAAGTFCAFVLRSAMAGAGSPGGRVGVYLGGLLGIAALLAWFSWLLGDNDGLWQLLLAFVAAIPMVLVAAGGIVEIVSSPKGLARVSVAVGDDSQDEQDRRASSLVNL